MSMEKKSDERLVELAEKTGESVFLELKCAKSTHRTYAEPIETEPKLLQKNNLGETVMNGGVGIRAKT